MADGSERKGPRVVEPGWGVGHRSADTVEVPDELNGMPVTAELRKMYEGFSELIYVYVTTANPPLPREEDP